MNHSIVRFKVPGTEKECIMANAFDSYVSAKNWLKENGLRLTNEFGEPCLFYIKYPNVKEPNNGHQLSTTYCFTQESYVAITAAYWKRKMFIYKFIQFIKPDGTVIDFIDNTPLKNSIENKYPQNVWAKSKEFVEREDVTKEDKLTFNLLNYTYYNRRSMYDLTKIYIYIPQRIINYLNMTGRDVNFLLTHKFNFLFTTTKAYDILDVGDRLFLKVRAFGCNNFSNHNTGIPISREINNVCYQLYNFSEIEVKANSKYAERLAQEKEQKEKKEKEIQEKKQKKTDKKAKKISQECFTKEEFELR